MTVQRWKPHSVSRDIGDARRFLFQPSKIIIPKVNHGHSWIAYPPRRVIASTQVPADGRNRWLYQIKDYRRVKKDKENMKRRSRKLKENVPLTILERAPLQRCAGVTAKTRVLHATPPREPKNVTFTGTNSNTMKSGPR